MQSSAYWVSSTIIQGMRLFVHWCMYHLIGLDASIGATLVHVLVYWSRSTIIYGMRLFLHCTVGTTIALSVSVYNHPRDAFISALLAHVLIYWS